MLLEFKLKNYRSFKNEATLTMLPVNAYKEHPENMSPVKPVGIHAEGVLSASVIYGPNASGKTNLLKAMGTARAIVVGSANASSVHLRDSFVNDNTATYFFFSFMADGNLFRYGFSFDAKGVVSEELRVQPKIDRLVFKRTRNETGQYSVSQGSKYSGIETKLRDFGDTGLILGLLSKFGIKDCKTAYDWFESSLVVLTDPAPLEYGALLGKLKGLGEQNFSKAISAVKSADLGITGAQLAISELTEEERAKQKIATDKLKAIYEILTGSNIKEAQAPGEKIMFQFKHVIGDNAVGFGFENESLGTITMLNLAADFINAISSGKVLVVDEIERSLHPVLLKSLVALFFDRELNSKNAQLIFTTHDLMIMDTDFLRRDQIWFVDKKQTDGASDLYALSEYSPRKEDNVSNKYLFGAYGAIPFIERIV